MSDIAKWALLIAAVLTIIIAILTFPFAQYLPTGAQDIANQIDVILLYCGSAFYNVRAFINLFLTPIGRSVLSGLIVYLFASWIIKLTIKISVWIFHFIFK